MDFPDKVNADGEERGDGQRFWRYLEEKNQLCYRGDCKCGNKNKNTLYGEKSSLTCLHGTDNDDAQVYFPHKQLQAKWWHREFWDFHIEVYKGKIWFEYWVIKKNSIWSSIKT